MNEPNYGINERRKYQIIKHNDLIQRTKYDLSMQEQKILAYLISRIKPKDDDFKFYKFRIKDFYQVCGIEETSGGNYSVLKAALLGIQNKGFFAKNDAGQYVSMNWVEKSIITPKDGVFEIRFDKDMKPFLLQLKKQFTQYSLYYILAMESKFSIRLYELIKSYEEFGECEFEIDRLKVLLNAEKYAAFADFRVRALDMAVREINDFTDLNVTYELKKQGRKFAWVKFLLIPNTYEGNIRKLNNIQAALDDDLLITIPFFGKETEVHDV